jgi:hypothetical protein
MDSSFFFFTCALPLIALQLFAHKTAKKFAELYKRKVDHKQIFSPEEFNMKYANDPSHVFTDSPKLVFSMYKIMFRKYSDRELNRKANILRMYFFASCLVLILNFIWSLTMLY